MILIISCDFEDDIGSSIISEIDSGGQNHMEKMVLHYFLGILAQKFNFPLYSIC